MVHSGRAAFLAAAGQTVTDDYEALGCRRLPADDPPPLSDAEMTAVRGLAAQQASGDLVEGASRDHVIRLDDAAPDSGHSCCAGCNGSFKLTFATPLLGGARGTAAVGFDYAGVPTFVASPGTPYVAFVSLGDNTTRSYALSTSADFGTTLPYFFGLTSTLGIRSVAVGPAGGGATQEGGFVLDNLSVAVVPEPAAPALALAGLAAVALAVRRRRPRAG